MNNTYCIDKRIFILLAFALPLVVVILGSIIFNSQKISSNSRADEPIIELVPTYTPTSCDLAQCPDGKWCIVRMEKPVCSSEPIAAVHVYGEEDKELHGILEAKKTYRVSLDFLGYGKKKIDVLCGDRVIPLDTTIDNSIFCTTSETPSISVRYDWNEPITNRLKKGVVTYLPSSNE